MDKIEFSGAFFFEKKVFQSGWVDSALGTVTEEKTTWA